MKKIWSKFLFFTLIFSSMTVLAEPASKESIRVMMDKTGAGDMGVQMMNQMLPALKQMLPNAPETFWVDIMAEMNANDIIEMVIPVYQKYLTDEDVQQINSFYDTDAGKKLIRVQPAIMQESMELGQQWGQEVARGVLVKYQESSPKQP